jgi:hypothetical protein
LVQQKSIGRNTRLLISTFSCLIAGLPWIIPVIKKWGITFFSISRFGEKSDLLFILASSVLWILTGLFIPVMLISASPQEFSYIDSYTTPLFFIGNTLLQSFGLFIFWPVCLNLLFSKNLYIKKVFVCLSLILAFSALFDAFIFSGHYGPISINMIFSGAIEHTFYSTIINFAVLVGIAAILLVLFFKRKNSFFIPVTSFSLFALLAFSAFNLFRIDAEYRKVQEFHKESQSAVTAINPIFHLSKTGKNTIVIMLDRAMNSFVPFILEESPDLIEAYSGFVYYPNTVSFGGNTVVGAPPLFGGYEYSPVAMNKRDSIPMVTKHNEALLLMPRIFSGAGYHVTVTDPPFPNYNFNNDLRIYDPYPEIEALITDSVYTDFWLNEHTLSLPSISDNLKRNMLWYSLFKISPLVFRRVLYQGGDWCALFSVDDLITCLDAYAVLDYLPALTGFAAKKDNTFLLMVNNTPHENAALQAPEYRPSINVVNSGSSPFKNVSAYHVNIAALKRLADWFAYLKMQDVYDNTRIILVSDHGIGNRYADKMPDSFPIITENFNPLLLVKDFNARGGIKTDMTFMSNADVPFLALNNQIENPENPFTHEKISIDEKKKPLYIAISTSHDLEAGTQFILNSNEDYYVHDNIFDESNWIKVKQ